MSFRMRLAHAVMGLMPPVLHSEEATRAVAESAPQHTAMPASMRARFTESCQGGVTRVAPTRGLRSGGALI